jgi:Spy/CpxP family protein refolding chaperone
MEVTMKKWYLGMVVLFLFGLATVVFAAPPDQAPPDQGTAQQQGMMHEGMGHEGMGHEGMMHHGMHHEGMMHHGFKFTPEQKAKMREIWKTFWADTHDLRYDMKVKRLELRKLFTDPKADNGVLLAKEKELNAMRLKLMDRKAEMKIEWRKVLTPEQIAMLDRPEGRFGHHHHHHPMAER